MHVIIPLYAHHSSKQWKTLLSKSLSGAVVIINPNDGWLNIPDPRDIRAWSELYRALTNKGAQVLAYVDLCRAQQGPNGEWRLRKKPTSDIQRERVVARSICGDHPVGLFLDDYSPAYMTDKTMRWVEALSAGPGPCCGSVINPGTFRDVPSQHVGMTHETNGYPRSAGKHRAWIAYGSAWDPKHASVKALRRGYLFYVHDTAEENKPNPLMSLSDSLDAQLQHAFDMRRKVLI